MKLGDYMNRSKFILMTAAIIATALPLLAQQKRLSPHETISTVVDGNRVTVVYGRPYAKSPRTGEIRKIWGGLVPYGKVWRTGADEATLLVTEKPLVFGDTTVPAGAYTLFTLPASDGSCKLIINKQIGQWGLEYHEDQDLGRVDLKKDDLQTPVNQFTMELSKDPSATAPGAGVLSLKWESIQYSVPFSLSE